MRIRFVEVEGIRTRCLYAGDEKAFPLLLIHGRSLSAEIWLRNIDALGENFHVVAPDVLGNGFTGPVEFDDGPAIARRLRHLTALVEVLGWRQFCACGSSHGALLAALMYFEMPSRVTKLVINGSAACSSPDETLATHLSDTLKKDDGDIGNSTLAEWRNRCGRSLYDPSVVPDELPAILLTAYAQPWVQRAWKQSLLSFMDVAGMQRYRIVHRWQKMDVDTLVVWGAQDPGAPLANGERMAAALPRARLVAFEKCGHMPMLEHPKRYNELVRSFLAK